MKMVAVAGLVALALAGCVSTQEMPIAPNMVRLDTNAGGMLFTGQAVPRTMRAAAEATLRAGYTRFRLADVSSGQGSEIVGVDSTSNAYLNGSTTGNFLTASGTAFGSDTVIRRPTAHAGATVIMLHDNDPGAAQAFDAAAVLKQYAS